MDKFSRAAGREIAEEIPADEYILRRAVLRPSKIRRVGLLGMWADYLFIADSNSGAI